MKNIFPEILIILLLLNLSILFGEEYSNLFDLYEAKKFEILKSELSKLNQQQKESNEVKFINAVFMENGEEAVKIYKSLFDRSSGRLKKYISRKLSDYYYAKGYYITASKYQEYLVEKSTAPDRKPDDLKDKFIIQLGAFGLHQNAKQLKEMLETQNLFPFIVERMINGKRLYCVWMDGKDNFSQTLKYAENIKQKYQLQYRIIQP